MENCSAIIFRIEIHIMENVSTIFFTIGKQLNILATFFQCRKLLKISAHPMFVGFVYGCTKTKTEEECHVDEPGFAFCIQACNSGGAQSYQFSFMIAENSNSFIPFSTRLHSSHYLWLASTMFQLSKQKKSI